MKCREQTGNPAQSKANSVPKAIIDPWLTEGERNVDGYGNLIKNIRAFQ